jgi:hypothetical protein
MISSLSKTHPDMLSQSHPDRPFLGRTRDMEALCSAATLDFTELFHKSTGTSRVHALSESVTLLHLDPTIHLALTPLPKGPLVL